MPRTGSSCSGGCSDAAATRRSAGKPPLASDWEGVAVADFDGDGTSDVLWRRIATGEIAVSLFHAGAIAVTQRLDVVGSEPLREVVGTGDLDGDGHADVLVRSIGGAGLRLWRMNGTALISRTRIADLGAGWITAGVGDESPSSQRWHP